MTVRLVRLQLQLGVSLCLHWRTLGMAGRLRGLRRWSECWGTGVWAWAGCRKYTGHVETSSLPDGCRHQRCVQAGVKPVLAAAAHWHAAWLHCASTNRLGSTCLLLRCRAAAATDEPAPEPGAAGAAGADPWSCVEFHVKWRRLSFIHTSWQPLEALRDLPGFKRVLNYIK